MSLFESFCNNFFISAPIFRQLPYILVFKTTNYCWFKCPHCCENAGPDQEKTYIPFDTIRYYLEYAKRDSKFAGDVVFTGGEIFSAYRFGDKDYIKNILNFTLDNKFATDIKTNAGWANTSFGQEIFRDLKDVIMNHKPVSTKFPMLQISLSLDRFHKNCIENNLKIFQELCGLPVIIHISSFDKDVKIVEEFESQLLKLYPSETAYTMNEKGELSSSFRLFKDNTLYISSFVPSVFKSGRANNLNEAKQIETPQFSFVSRHSGNYSTLVAFDSFGRVTLGENSGRKISTPWIDDDGKRKTMPKIISELYKNCIKEDLYFRFYESLFLSR